jgi:hypothetical protein
LACARSPDRSEFMFNAPIRRRLGPIVDFRLPHSNVTNSRQFHTPAPG